MEANSIVNIIVALLGITGALAGGYLGVRGGFKQYAKEQQYEELLRRRDYLRQWMSDNHQKILCFDGCCDDASKQSLVTREEIDGLLNNLQILRIHFLDDPLGVDIYRLEESVNHYWETEDRSEMFFK